MIHPDRKCGRNKCKATWKVSLVQAGKRYSLCTGCACHLLALRTQTTKIETFPGVFVYQPVIAEKFVVENCIADKEVQRVQEVKEEKKLNVNGMSDSEFAEFLAAAQSGPEIRKFLQGVTEKVLQDLPV